MAQAVISDNFNSANYSGGTGWKGNWLETSDSNGPNGGRVLINGGRLRFEGIFRNNQQIKRTCDLNGVGATSASLKFNWETVSLNQSGNDGEELNIQISSNSNGPFTTIGSFRGEQTGVFEQDISTYISANTTIRLINTSTLSWGDWESGEYVYIDNVEIKYYTAITDPCTPLSGSVTIWEEDFGGAPKGSSSTTSIRKLQYPSNQSGGWGMVGSNVNPEGEWVSNVIDISNHENLKVSLDIGSWSTGNGLEETGSYIDYIRIYYSVDDGAEQLFNSNEEIFGTVGTLQACAIIPEGNNVVIKVVMKSTAGDEYHYIDNVLVSGTILTPDTEAPIFVQNPNITIPAEVGKCGADVYYNTPIVTDNKGAFSGNLAGYTYVGTYNDHTYYLSDATELSAAAADEMYSLGGHLVTITSPGENDFLRDNLSERFWMGLTDEETEGEFKWVTGEDLSLYDNWSTNEPNDYSGNEDWVEMYDNGTWNDMLNDHTRKYVAEFEGPRYVQTEGLISGAFFPVGTTTNTFTATDAAGNVGTMSFTVTVTDKVFPVISACPANITVNSNAGVCGAVVNWTEPTASDNCTATGDLVWNKSVTPGSTFPIGTTKVTYKVKDESGNESVCNFNVIVVDNENPQISCQTNITHVLFCEKSSVDISIPTPTDNCNLQSLTYRIGGGVESANLLSNTGSISINLPSAGDHTITWTATDVNGNSNSCNFMIHVDAEPVIDVLTAVNATCATSNDGQISIPKISVESGGVEYSVDGGSNWQSSNLFKNLSPNTYNVKIRTNIGGDYCESASQTVSVNQPSALSIGTSNVVDASCSANADGKIDLSITGGDQVMHFDGTDSYIALDLNYNSVTAISSMTVAAWVKVGPNSGDGDWSILDFDRSEYFNFSIESGYKLRLSTNSDNGGGINDFQSDTDIGDDEWHFVVGVYDGVDKHIFIDGILDKSTSNPHGSNRLGAPIVRYAFIGTGSEAVTFNGNKNDGRIFNGNIANVWYFESSITDLNDLNELSKGVIPTGHTPKGNWRLSDISNGFIPNLADLNSYGEVIGMDASNIDDANLYSLSCTKDGVDFDLLGNLSVVDANNFKLTNLAVGDYTLIVTDNYGCSENVLFEIKNGDVTPPVISAFPSNRSICAQDKSTQKAVVSGIDLPTANYVDNCGGDLTVQYQIKDKNDVILIAYGTGSDASGFSFPLGENTVTYKVSDSAGNSSEVFFKVTVNPKPSPLGIYF